MLGGWWFLVYLYFWWVMFFGIFLLGEWSCSVFLYVRWVMFGIFIFEVSNDVRYIFMFSECRSAYLKFYVSDFRYINILVEWWCFGYLCVRWTMFFGIFMLGERKYSLYLYGRWLMLFGIFICYVTAVVRYIYMLGEWCCLV
jgi:hypothetical protein